MSEYPISDSGAADPTTEEFWSACADRRLTIQQCEDCEHCQMYPRPFCLQCGSGSIRMVNASGQGAIYAITTIRIPVTDELPPPYQLALVDLAEGPRLLTNIVGDGAAIGDRVTVDWRERTDLPPVPVFRKN